MGRQVIGRTLILTLKIEKFSDIQVMCHEGFKSLTTDVVAMDIFLDVLCDSRLFRNNLNQFMAYLQQNF
jgi:hypothetical protein